MANHILPHIDACAYQISSKNLEELHLKVNQGTAVLSILGDWVCVDSHSFFDYDCKGRLMHALYLLADLLQNVEKLLPEV